VPTAAPKAPEQAPAPTVLAQRPPVTESPFGPYVGPPPVIPQAPKLADPPPERPEPRRSGGWLWIVILLAGVSADAAGAWFGGLFDAYLRPSPEPESRYASWPSREPRPDGWARPPAPVRPVEPDPGSQPPPDAGADAVDDVAERVHWVRSFAGGPCFFASTTSASMREVAVEGFGDTVEAFRKLLSGFMEKFGIEPQITVGLIRPVQCPVTDFLNALGERPSVAPGLALEKYELANRDPMAGEVQLLPSGQTYLFLVDHDGIVHNLETFLKREGGKAVFRIALGLATASEDGGAGLPQVLVALGSEAPIEAFRDGTSTSSADLLPRILEEIRRKNIGSAATAKFFLVRG
jgi:serine/threonine-protein kinase